MRLLCILPIEKQIKLQNSLIQGESMGIQPIHPMPRCQCTAHNFETLGVIPSAIPPNPSASRHKPSFWQRIWNPFSSARSTRKLPSAVPIKQKTSLLKKIWNAAASILNLGLGVLLYWTNNSLFAISFFIGIIRNEEVAYSIKKINDVWKTQPFNTFLIGSFGSFLGGVGSLLSLPITVAAASVLYAANLGCNLSQKAQEILNATATTP